MDILTDTEKQTLNDAMAIILAHTERGASWSIHAAFYDFNTAAVHDVSYFDSQRTQHSGITAGTFADKIEAALQIEAAVEKDAEVIRLRKVEKLRAELAALEA